jgi:ABC-type amino acid transport system permease subunit
MKKDVRKSVLYYGPGQHVIVAAVEIIFDNTDRQFPVRQILIIVLNQGATYARKVRASFQSVHSSHMDFNIYFIYEHMPFG